jgi:uncharacterized membrane protein YdbT with pleckstrin-like domain
MTGRGHDTTDGSTTQFPIQNSKNACDILQVAFPELQFHKDEPPPTRKSEEDHNSDNTASCFKYFEVRKGEIT